MGSREFGSVSTALSDSETCSPHLMLALIVWGSTAGCVSSCFATCDPQEWLQERGCSAEPVVTTNHINVEAWTESYASTWAQIERDYPQNAPRNLGNMGFLVEMVAGWSLLKQQSLGFTTHSKARFAQIFKCSLTLSILKMEDGKRTRSRIWP